MEVLELIELLAHGGELDRTARDGLDGKRGSSPSVAVELRQHHAVEVDPLLEGERDVDGLLARHRIEDEQYVLRLRLPADGGELVHQRLVDVQAARRVEDDDVAALV